MEISAQFLILVPVVLGVVQAIKIAGLATRWAPLLSVVLGVVIAFCLTWANFTSLDFLQGIVAGLSAAGLWSGVKTTAGK